LKIDQLESQRATLLESFNTATQSGQGASQELAALRAKCVELDNESHQLRSENATAREMAAAEFYAKNIEKNAEIKMLQQSLTSKAAELVAAQTALQLAQTNVQRARGLVVRNRLHATTQGKSNLLQLVFATWQLAAARNTERLQAEEISALRHQIAELRSHAAVSAAVNPFSSPEQQTVHPATTDTPARDHITASQYMMTPFDASASTGGIEFSFSSPDANPFNAADPFALGGSHNPLHAESDNPFSSPETHPNPFQSPEQTSGHTTQESASNLAASMFSPPGFSADVVTKLVRRDSQTAVSTPAGAHFAESNPFSPPMFSSDVVHQLVTKPVIPPTEPAQVMHPNITPVRAGDAKSDGRLPQPVSIASEKEVTRMGYPQANPPSVALSGTSTDSPASFTADVVSQYVRVGQPMSPATPVLSSDDSGLPSPASAMKTDTTAIPCSICGRAFPPESLGRHSVACFDSAKVVRGLAAGSMTSPPRTVESPVTVASGGIAAAALRGLGRFTLSRPGSNESTDKEAFAAPLSVRSTARAGSNLITSPISVQDAQAEIERSRARAEQLRRERANSNQ
jgi:hypothetical protein